MLFILLVLLPILDLVHECHAIVTGEACKYGCTYTHAGCDHLQNTEAAAGWQNELRCPLVGISGHVWITDIPSNIQVLKIGGRFTSDTGLITSFQHDQFKNLAQLKLLLLSGFPEANNIDRLDMTRQMTTPEQRGYLTVFPDVSGCTSLVTLSVNHQRIKMLPATAFVTNTALKYLMLNSNDFEGTLPVTQFQYNPQLKVLWLQGNKLSGFIHGDTFKNQALLNLDLGYNHFSGIGANTLAYLGFMSCCLPGTHKDTNVYLAHNDWQTISYEANKVTESVGQVEITSAEDQVSTTRMKNGASESRWHINTIHYGFCFADGCSYDTDLKCSYDATNQILDCSHLKTSADRTRHLSGYMNIKNIPSDVTEINFDNNYLLGFVAGQFSGLTALKKLSFRDNQITSLDTALFEDLTSLEILQFDGNPIVNLPNDLLAVPGSALLHVSFGYLKITTLSPTFFATNTNLKTINMQGNRLESLNENTFANNINLIGLTLARNRFTVLPKNLLNTNLKLLELFTHSNPFTSDMKLGNDRATFWSLHSDLVTYKLGYCFDGGCNHEDLGCTYEAVLPICVGPGRCRTDKYKNYEKTRTYSGLIPPAAATRSNYFEEYPFYLGGNHPTYDVNHWGDENFYLDRWSAYGDEELVSSSMDCSNQGISGHVNILNLPSSLVTLDLSSNQIASFDANEFDSLIKLKELYLQENKLKTLALNQFALNVDLETLDLRTNDIFALATTQFKHNSKLRFLNGQDILVERFFAGGGYIPFNMEFLIADEVIPESFNSSELELRVSRLVAQMIEEQTKTTALGGKMTTLEGTSSTEAGKVTALEGKVLTLESTSTTEAGNVLVLVNTTSRLENEMETLSKLTGPKGNNGLDGTDGADGQDGVNGVNGADGANGADGKDGTDGKDGENGERGERGIRGDQGLTGDQGEKGEKDADRGASNGKQTEATDAQDNVGGSDSGTDAVNNAVADPTKPPSVDPGVSLLQVWFLSLANFVVLCVLSVKTLRDMMHNGDKHSQTLPVGEEEELHDRKKAGSVKVTPAAISKSTQSEASRRMEERKKRIQSATPKDAPSNETRASRRRSRNGVDLTRGGGNAML